MGNVINLNGHRLSRRQVFDGGWFDLPGLGFEPRPTFTITPEDRVLVMGSCFAVEILKALTARGFDASDADLGLQYNAPSMLQQWRWATGAPIESGSLIPVIDRKGEPRVADPCAYRRRTFADVDEAVAARALLAADLGAALQAAGVVVLTFGLVEVWRDEEAGVDLNITPPAEAILESPSRYRCVRQTHAQSLEAMASIFRVIHRANPSAKVVATVSPVPLAATFTGPDVLIANCYSKSTLRSALTEAIDSAKSESPKQKIDYFPSYELVTLCERSDVWRPTNEHGEPDGRHVRPEFVQDVIMRCFLGAYTGSTNEPAPNPG